MLNTEIFDFIVCNFNKSNKHIINTPRILSCGHTFCFSCLDQSYSQSNLINCTICNSIENEKPSDLIVNQFIFQIFASFPQLYIKAIRDHKDEIEKITIGEKFMIKIFLSFAFLLKFNNNIGSVRD